MPKLVVLNHLTPERLERLQRVRPDATVEAYAKMSEALPHLEDADGAPWIRFPCWKPRRNCAGCTA